METLSLGVVLSEGLLFSARGAAPSAGSLCSCLAGARSLCGGILMVGG